VQAKSGELMQIPMTRLAKTITAAPLFRGFIIVVILWAGVLAGLETSAALMASHGALFRAIDSVVLAIFVAEIGLKLAAHGRRWTDYFRDGWNTFDCAVVALCFIPGSGSFSTACRRRMPRSSKGQGR
jgi:voltage-gated sodium channel